MPSSWSQTQPWSPSWAVAAAGECLHLIYLLAFKPWLLEMAFHSQSPGSAAGMALHAGSVSGHRAKPSWNGAWEICAAPVTLYLWALTFLLFCFFSFENSADFLPSEVLGASRPGSDCISLDTERKTHGVLRWVAFPGDNSWTWTCCYFFGEL